jgi:hypothetical protein
MTRDEILAEWGDAAYNAQENYSMDPHEHIARLIAAGDQLAALATPAPVAAPPADLVAQQIADCNRVRAFLEQRARATGRLRDASSYAEAAAMIGAYADALTRLPAHRGAR